ncbi:MAG: dihydroorotate dehydrogenase electron transfer subunit [Oscillospiraceae bacterium]|nr:dihydroorotate dehydrogenase electron transfer subunit [Oscillospiraceae bacterium]
MYKCGAYPVIEKTAISAGIYSYEILCPEIAELSKPGQFVHIKIDGFTLRRPISICDIDYKNGSLRIVFEIRGQGTAKLTSLNVGDNIDMIAPLGKGFTLPDNLHPNNRVLLVGGGIGVPPLLAIAKTMKESATAILGFRSYDKIILAGDFKSADAHVIPCTDDGSVGFHGAVTIPLAQELSKGDVTKVYACGPEAMLKAVIDECENAGVSSEVSLEERMGCGVGACVVCACETERGMARVCKDGPVFDGKEVYKSLGRKGAFL